MSKKKDPTKIDKNSLDDDLNAANFGGENDDFLAGMEDMDFGDEKDRKPLTKIQQYSKDIINIGKGTVSGAIAGAGSVISNALPDASALVDDALDVASDAKALKDETIQKARPLINNIKQQSRQALTLAKDLVPSGIYDKLMKKLEVDEEETTSSAGTSKKEARKIGIENQLNAIFKTQMEVNLDEKRRDVANKLIDDRITSHRHSEIANMLSSIRQQSLFNTAFMRTTFTAYMKKDLELKYQHMYLTEDIRELTKASAVMLDQKLTAIVKNTGLPDSQKLTKTELLKNNLIKKVLDSSLNNIGNYGKQVLKNVKDNYITPTLNGLGTVSDMSEMLMTAMSGMGEMEGSGSMRATVTGSIGSMLGSALGNMGGRKLLNKLSPEASQLLQDMSKQGFAPVRQFLHKKVQDSGYDGIWGVLDNVLPGMRRGTENLEAEGMNSNSRLSDFTGITKKFTTTVEEVIPRYLAEQTKYLARLAGDRSADTRYFNFRTHDLENNADRRREIQNYMKGSAQSRASILKGNQMVTDELISSHDETTKQSYEDTKTELAKMMANISKILDDQDLNGHYDDIRKVSIGSDWSKNKWLAKAFKGIKNPKEVASMFVALTSTEDMTGELVIDQPALSAIKTRIVRLTASTQDRMYDAGKHLLSSGYSFNEIREATGGTVDSTGKLNFDEFWRNEYSDIDKSVVEAAYGETEYDDFGIAKTETNAPFKVFQAAKSTASYVGGKIADLTRGAASLIGQEENYDELLKWVRTNYNHFCALCRLERMRIKKMVRDLKDAAIKKTYEYISSFEADEVSSNGKLTEDMKASHFWRGVKTLIWDEDGNVREKLKPEVLLDCITRTPFLHRRLIEIHRCKSPINYVIDQLLPEIVRRLACIDEETINSILAITDYDARMEAFTEALSKVPPKKAETADVKSDEQAIKDAGSVASEVNPDQVNAETQADTSAHPEERAKSGGDTIKNVVRETPRDNFVKPQTTNRETSSSSSSSSSSTTDSGVDDGSSDDGGDSSEDPDSSDSSLGGNPILKALKDIKRSVDGGDSSEDPDSSDSSLGGNPILKALKDIKRSVSGLRTDMRGYFKGSASTSNNRRGSNTARPRTTEEKADEFYEKGSAFFDRLSGAAGTIFTKSKELGSQAYSTISTGTKYMYDKGKKLGSQAYDAMGENAKALIDHGKNLGLQAGNVATDKFNELTSNLFVTNAEDKLITSLDDALNGKVVKLHGPGSISALYSKLHDALVNDTSTGELTRDIRATISALTDFIKGVKAADLWSSLSSQDRSILESFARCIDADINEDTNLAFAKFPIEAFTPATSTNNHGVTPDLYYAIDRTVGYGRAVNGTTRDKAEWLGGAMAGQTTDLLNTAKNKAGDLLNGARDFATEQIDSLRDYFGNGKKQQSSAAAPAGTQPNVNKEQGWLAKLVSGAGKVVGSVTDFAGDIFGRLTGSGKIINLLKAQLEVQKSILLATAGQTDGELFTKLSKILEKYDENGKETKTGVFSKLWTGVKALAKAGKSLAIDVPISLASSAAVGTGHFVRSFAKDDVEDVYVRPLGDRPIDPIEDCKLSSENFLKGVYFDPKGKKRVKSVRDINKPVYDGDGNRIIGPDDIKQGLVDINGKPLRDIGDRLGRAGRRGVGLATDAATGIGSAILGMGIFSAAWRATKTTASTGINVFRHYQDVYLLNEDGTLADPEPLIYAREISKGLVGTLSKSGKFTPLKDSYSIDAPIYYSRVKANGEKAGTCAINEKQIPHLGTVDGKPLNTFLNRNAARLGRVAGGALSLAGSAIKTVTGRGWDILSFAMKVAKKLTVELFEKENPYVNVYVKDDEGRWDVKRPVLKGPWIKEGKYFYADGKLVTSAYGLKGAVFNKKGHCIITEADIENGLVVDVEGHKLTKFRGRSIAGKIGHIATAGAWKTIKLLGKGIGKVTKGAYRLATSGVKKLFSSLGEAGAEVVDYMATLWKDSLKILSDWGGVKIKDLKEIVGDRLVNIYDLLNARLPKPTGVSDDADGDGDRDGSYADHKQKVEADRKRRKEKTEEAKKAKADKKTKEDATKAAAAKGEADDDDSGFMWGLSDVKDGWDLLKKGGRGVGRLIGKGARGIGSLTRGGLGLLGKTALGKSATGFAGKYLTRAALTSGAKGLAGRALTGAIAGGSTILGGMSSAAAATTAASAAGAGIGGSLLAGAGALGSAIAAAPLVWLAATGLALYTGYKVINWALSDSSRVKAWKEARYSLYGVDSKKHDDVMEDLEKHVLDMIDKQADAETIDKEKLEEFAVEFGLIKKGSFFGMFGKTDSDKIIKEKMEYFTTWYAKRFCPIFGIYNATVSELTERQPGDKLDPDDISEDDINERALASFKKSASTVLTTEIKNFIPTLKAYNAWKRAGSKDAKGGKKGTGSDGNMTTLGTRMEQSHFTNIERKKGGWIKRSAKFIFDHSPVGIVWNFGVSVLKYLKGEGDDWYTLRTTNYGFNKRTNATIRSAILDLEKKLLEEFDGVGDPVTDDDIYEFGNDINFIPNTWLVNTSDEELKDRKHYLKAWYAQRFRPIYRAYWEGMNQALPEREAGEEFDPEDLDIKVKDSLYSALQQQFDKIIRQDGVKDLKPFVKDFREWIKKGKPKLSVEVSEKVSSNGGPTTDAFGNKIEEKHFAKKEYKKGGFFKRALHNVFAYSPIGITKGVADWVFGKLSGSGDDWYTLRMTSYGFKEKPGKTIHDAIEDLEERVRDEMDGEDNIISDEDVIAFGREIRFLPPDSAGNFIYNLFSSSETKKANKEALKAKEDYLKQWYGKRFRPLYDIYFNVMSEALPEREPGDDFDPDELEDIKVKDQVFLTLQQEFTKLLSASDAKFLVPTEEGYQEWLKGNPKKNDKEEYGPEPAPASVPVPTTVTEENLTKDEKAEFDKLDNAGKIEYLVNKNKNSENQGSALMKLTSLGVVISGITWVMTELTGSETSDDILKVRYVDGYGYENIKDAKKHRNVLDDLEERVLGCFDGTDIELDDSDIEKFAERLGIIDSGFLGLIGGDSDKLVKDKMGYVVGWYAKRFRPIFEAYVDVITKYTERKPGGELDFDSIKADLKDAAIQEFAVRVDNILKDRDLKDYVPTSKGYDNFVKLREQLDAATGVDLDKKDELASMPSPALQNIVAEVDDIEKKAKEKQSESDAQNKTNESFLKKLSSKFSSTLSLFKSTVDKNKDQEEAITKSWERIKEKKKSKGLFGDLFSSDDDDDDDATSRVNSESGSDPGFSGSTPVGPSESNNVDGTSQGTDGPLPEVDMSNITAADIPDGGQSDLGFYVKKFESGDRGPESVGFDKTGGTSYGSYQIASRTGTFKEFLAWAEKNGGELGKKLATAFRQLGNWDDGSHGRGAQLWGQFAKLDGGEPLHKLEHAYIKATHYDVALRKLNPQAKALVESNRGLQEALWSSAVCCGPGGCGKLFNRVYKAGMSAEDFARAIYAARPGNFKSYYKQHRERADRELPIILGLVGKGDSSGAPGSTPSSSVDPSMTSTDNGFNSNTSSSSTSDYSSSTSTPFESSSPTNIPIDGVDTSSLTIQKGVDFSGTSPLLQQRLGAAAKEYEQKYGKKVIVTGGKRSLAQQDALYKQYGPKRAAKPNPLSPHISGLAADINSADANAMEKDGLLQKYGLWRPLKNGLGRTIPEAWHVELAGSRDPNSKTITRETLAALNATGLDPNAGAPGKVGDPSSTDTSADGEESQSLSEQAKTEQDKETTSAPGTPGTPGGTSSPVVTEQANQVVEKLNPTSSDNSSAPEASSSDVSTSAVSSTTTQSAPTSDSTSSVPPGTSPAAPAPASTDTGFSASTPPSVNVQTETPSQTGNVGEPISNTEALGELKLISQILTGIRQDLGGHWQQEAKTTKTPETLSKESASTSVVNTNATSNTENTQTSSSSNADIVKALQDTLGPSSPLIQSVISALENAGSDKSSSTPKQSVEVRSPIDVTKKRNN